MTDTPYSKMSKKKKKEINSSRRTKWNDMGILNPVTRIVENRKKHNNKYMCRKKEESRHD